MANPGSPDPLDENFYPGYTQQKEEWRESGCLPPDEAESRLQQLAANVQKGLIDEAERKRIASNADYVCKAGIITSKMRRMVLEAVKVDDNGNLQNLG